MKKRLIVSLLCLLFLILFNFILPRLMPGDTVLMLVGMDEEQVSQAQYAFYAEKSGANLSTGEQFIGYMRGLLRGDLGYSWHQRENVADLIARRLPGTLQIAVPALVLSSLIALGAGCSMGMRRGLLPEKLCTTLQILFNALPTFLTGLLLLYFLAFRLQWLPTGALNSMRVADGFWNALFDRVRHLALPVGTLVIASTPAKYLMLANTVARERKEKYVVYARARGLSKDRIAFCHILPNVFQPYLAMVGMSAGHILAGSLVIENIFSIKGMGGLMAAAVSSRDYPVLQGCLLVSGLMVIGANLLTDILCIALDPKLRYKSYEA